MAFNSVTDAIEPKAISQYFQAELHDRLQLVASGAASMDLDALAKIGGDTIDIRKFQDDTTGAELNDGSSSSGAVVGSYRDIGVVTRRKRVRGVDDSVKAAMGTGDADIVNREIARVNAFYWQRELERSLAKVISAHFATSGALVSTHLNQIGTTSGTPRIAQYGDITGTAKKLGDNSDELKIMIVPNYVWADLKNEAGAKISYNPIGSTGLNETYYDGMRVFVSNQMPTTGTGASTMYTTLLVRAGAFAIGLQRELGFLYQVDAKSAQEILTSTLDYCVHVRGVKWTGTAASGKAGATDTELATATNWAKAAVDNRDIGVVALKSNATQ